MIQHSAGVIKVARVFGSDTQLDRNADIIDEGTHASEMLAFIEKIAAWDYTDSMKQGDSILQAQAEAFELLKKWGVIIGVSKYKKCGKVSRTNDFLCSQTEDEWHDEMMGEIQRHGGGG